MIAAFLDKDDQEVRRARAAGLVASTSLAELMHLLTPLVTTRAITARASTLLMMHACVLADPSSGAAVVLAGPSGAGKTTVARTLGKPFGYVTDECAGIRDDHTVVPFPKPLSLVTGALSGVKDQASPSSLGLAEPPASPRVVAVLYLDRGDDAPEVPSLTAVPNVHALGLLCPQVSFVGSRPAPLRRIVSLLDSVGGLRRVFYREAADLSSVVGRLMKDVAAETRGPRGLLAASSPSQSTAVELGPGVDGPVPSAGSNAHSVGRPVAVRRTSYVDQYVEGGEGAVLVDDRVLVLSELATTLVNAVGDTGADMPALAHALQAEFGTPPQGVDLMDATHAAVLTLSRQGLLKLS